MPLAGEEEGGKIGVNDVEKIKLKWDRLLVDLVEALTLGTPGQQSLHALESVKSHQEIVRMRQCFGSRKTNLLSRYW